MVLPGLAVDLDQTKLTRATLRAGIRLSVKSAVGGVVVFLLASAAHGKLRHRRQGPVVRNVLNDGKARSAVGAVDKGIAIATILWIDKLGHTVVTDRHVR